MKELEKLLIRECLAPADVKTRVVYHYTSAAGLIGILGSGLIRGTNASFLNDTSEIEYGLSICMKVLEEERAARESNAERTVIERAMDMMRDDTLPDEVYVTSFSARRDLLSQWRAYGSADGRFCVGFQLSQFSERDFLQLPRPVEYSLPSQREQVRHAIDLTCQAAVEAGDDVRLAWSCATSLIFHLRRIMCGFKHPGFDEEQEWRSVTTMSPVDDPRPVHFEPYRGMPRPFIIMLAGSRTSDRLPVVEVCVGHTERKKAVYRATQLLLARYGHGDATVTESGIPFSG
ncbi:MAG: DUF2971 domain-containing protein [Thermoanaerobaculia bacterium]